MATCISTWAAAAIPDLQSTSFAYEKRFMFWPRLSYPLKINSKSRHKPRLSLSHPRCSLAVSADPHINLTVHRSSLINPLGRPEARSMFLSNIDRFVNFNISGLLFFSNNPSYSFENLVKEVETAYQKLLVPYDYLAGRLGRNEQGRLQVDCNFSGAGFVVATSELTLADLGDLVCPRPEFKKFATRKLPGRPVDDQPLFVMQITSLSCGGFVMGYSFNHMMFDGIGIKLFIENLASMAMNNSLFLCPLNNRELLAARSPPQISFPHSEFQKMDQSRLGPLLSRFKRHQPKVFRLSDEDIFKLKQEARASVNKSTIGITTFNVIVAHIWRCLALASNIEEISADKTLTLLYALNFRKRLVPRLPVTFTGNVLTNAVCKTTYSKLKAALFSELVQIVAEAEKQITNEYLRSNIDWTEINQGFMQGDILLSSIVDMGYTDVVYPWGKAIWYSPILPDRGNPTVMLLPDIEGTSDNGVNILMSLEPTKLHCFEKFFRLIPRA